MNDELQSSNETLQEHQDEVERLNQFMSSVLSSLTLGIAVVDKDLRIKGWNPTAEQLWGVRTEEAIGKHLFTLDIGLPLDRLRPLLREQLAGDGGDHAAIRLAAVNRRGRHVEVQVTVTRLLPGGDGQDGAIVAMDVVQPAAATAAASGDGQ